MVSMLPQRGAEGTWAPQVWLDVWAWLGPSLAIALIGVAVARSVLRRRRYRAVDVLGTDDRDAVHEALRRAERRTVGEIVPVVFERSDAHPAARWRAVAVAIFAGSTLFAVWLPWHAPHWLLTCQLGFGLLAAVLTSGLHDLRRAFVSEARATEVAEEQAFQEFFRLGLHATQARTGVLMFVSLFERRVVVLADAGIDGKVDSAAWTAARDAVLHGIERGSLRDGLITGIGQVGDVLSTHFPWQTGDRNEVPDRLVVQGE